MVACDNTKRLDASAVPGGHGTIGAAMGAGQFDTKRVLVMDDEAPLRRVVSRMLQFLGYDVMTAADGAEAIDVYRNALESNARFDIVILDLTVLAGLGGREAMQSILQVDPAAVTIASTGYTEDEVMERFTDFGFSGVLAKPYRLDDLRAKLESIMSAD